MKMSTTTKQKDFGSSLINDKTEENSTQIKLVTMIGGKVFLRFFLHSTICSLSCVSIEQTIDPRGTWH